MVGLRRARGVRRRELRAAIDARRRRDNQQVLVETDGEPRLPLRVGEARQRLGADALLREFRFETGAPRQQVGDAARRRVEPVISPAK